MLYVVSLPYTHTDKKINITGPSAKFGDANCMCMGVPVTLECHNKFKFGPPGDSWVLYGRLALVCRGGGPKNT